MMNFSYNRKVFYPVVALISFLAAYIPYIPISSGKESLLSWIISLLWMINGIITITAIVVFEIKRSRKIDLKFPLESNNFDFKKHQRLSILYLAVSILILLYTILFSIQITSNSLYSPIKLLYFFIIYFGLRLFPIIGMVYANAKYAHAAFNKTNECKHYQTVATLITVLGIGYFIVVLF